VSWQRWNQNGPLNDKGEIMSCELMMIHLAFVPRIKSIIAYPKDPLHRFKFFFDFRVVELLFSSHFLSYCRVVKKIVIWSVVLCFGVVRR